MSNPALKTLILGLGNALRGDDGVGAAVIAALAAVPLPPGVETLDGGTPGLETILLMQGYERVIIIDAADMERAPGEWLRFEPDQVSLSARDMHARGTLHYAGLAEALALGAAMNNLPPQIVIFGIQPAHIGWESGLSQAVAAAVPAVCAAVRQMLGTEP